MTEALVAMSCAVAGAVYVLSMGILETRLSALYRAHVQEHKAPKLLSSNPIVNARALAFIYSSSSRDIQDFVSIVFLNLARASFPAAIALGALAIHLSLAN